MADQNIKVKIDLDVAEFNKNAKALSDAISKVLGKDVDLFNGKIRQTAQYADNAAKSIGGATAAIGKATNAVKQSNQQWTNLALVIQDLPFGFRGIQNNLPALLGSFASVTGPIYLGFSAIIAALTIFDQNIKKTTTDVSKLSEKTSETRTEMTSFAGVFSAVRQGTLSARDATRMYNEKLGELFGYAKDVTQAEALYVSKTAAYVQAQYLRAKADVELEKAKEALKKKDAAYAEDQVGILGRLATATAAFFKAGAFQGIGGLYTTATIYAKDAIEQQLELAGYETQRQEAEFNKRIALFERYQSQAFAIEKKYGIKSTQYQDFIDKENEKRRKKLIADQIKAQKELEAALKKAAIRAAKAGGDIEVINEPTVDPKAQAKAFNEKMAFDKKMSKERVDLLKQQYDLEVSQAQGSFEEIKIAEENMRNALNQGFMDGSIKLSEYLDAIQELRKKSNKTASDEAKKAMQETLKIGIGIMNALGPALDMLLEKGASIGEVLSRAFTDVLKKLAKVAIAAAIAVAIMSMIPGLIQPGKGLATFGNLVGQGMGLGAQLFANGGIISGPTLGLMGEYPGAANNPEVVAPLDKLQSLIGGSGGQLEARISGNDLLILMNKAGRNNNNTF